MNILVSHYQPVLVLFVMTAVLAFSAGTMRAATLVVDGRHAKASDANAGTPEEPLKTISAAASKVSAGDKVIVHAGEYREVVIATVSGTKEKPIIFEAAPGETVVIKGSDIVKDWKRYQGAIWIAQMPKFRGDPKLTDKDPSFWDTNDIRQVFVQDGILFKAKRLVRADSLKAMREGAFYSDAGTGQVWVWLENSQSPLDRQIEVSTRGAWIYLFGNYTFVRGFQMRHSSTLGIANWPACQVLASFCRIEDCVLTWSDFVALGITGEGNTVKRCMVALCGNSGMGGRGQKHLIENNRFIYNNIDRYDPSWHSGGAKFIPGLCNSRILHNEFAHNIGPGLWLDTNCDGNLVNGNVCHSNQGAGIMVEVSFSNRVFNNICYLNRNDAPGEYLLPNPDAVKAGKHNVFDRKLVDDRKPSVVYYHAGTGAGIFISSAPQSLVFHNTCYMNQGEGISVEGIIRHDGGRDYGSYKTMVRNNIAVMNKGAQITLRRDGTDSLAVDNTADYNILYALAAFVGKAGWDGSGGLTLKDWQKVGTNDAHSLEINLRFADSAANDYRLLPGSPGLQSMPGLREVPMDFIGDSRDISGRVTPGAFENPAFLIPLRPEDALDLPFVHD